MHHTQQSAAVVVSYYYRRDGRKVIFLLCTFVCVCVCVCSGVENKIRSALGGDLVLLKWLIFKLKKS